MHFALLAWYEFYCRCTAFGSINLVFLCNCFGRPFRHPQRKFSNVLQMNTFGWKSFKTSWPQLEENEIFFKSIAISIIIWLFNQITWKFQLFQTRRWFIILKKKVLSTRLGCIKIMICSVNLHLCFHCLPIRKWNLTQTAASITRI